MTEQLELMTQGEVLRLTWVLRRTSDQQFGEKTDKSTRFKMTRIRQYISSSEIICCLLSLPEDLCGDRLKEHSFVGENKSELFLRDPSSFASPLK